MDRCIYSVMWILDLMAARVLIWRTDTLRPVPAIQMAVSIWFNKIAQMKCAKSFSTRISRSKLSCSHTRNWHFHWRVGFPSRLQLNPIVFLLSLASPEPCKTAVEPTFCGTKFLVLAIWLRDLFFWDVIIPTYCSFFDGSVIWRLCSEFLCSKYEFGGSQAALQCIFDMRGMDKHEKQSVIPPLFEHPSWRNEACHGY